MSSSLPWSTVAIAVFVSVLWGGNVVSIKIGVEVVPPIWSAFWRMLAGLIPVALWARWRGIDLRPGPGEWRFLAILGLLFSAQIALLNSGTHWTSPGFGVVILNSYAIFANIAGHFFHLEERLNGRRITGLLLAVSGVSVLALSRPDAGLAPRPLLGNSLLVLSAILLGIRLVYTRWMVQNIDPVRAVFWQMVVSLPVFFTGASLFEPMLARPLAWPAVAAILYQGFIVAGYCFIAWTTLLKRHPAGTLSMFAFLVPFSGILLSRILLQEQLVPTLAAGLALVIGGLILVAGRPSTPAVQSAR